MLKVKLKHIFAKHKIFLYSLLLIVAAAYIINIFVNPHTIILGGEYIFSFDDAGHVQNILQDSRSNLAQDTTNCFDCPDFYHYSRWYSLFKISYHSLAKVLHLHPFIFLILSMIITQFISLYIFVRTLFPKYSLIPFLVAAFVFILYPYKYSLIIETHDGLLYSNMVLYITLLIWSFNNLKTFSVLKAAISGIAAGLLFSFFLNVNIAFLPIAIYTTLIIGSIYWKTLTNNKIKILLYMLSIAIPALIINIPLLQSLIQNGNTRHYEGYISFNYIDSFLSGLSIAQTNPLIITSFALLFIFCFLYAPMTKKLKLWMLITYVLIALMINGTNSPIDIYGFMFKYIPLIDSLRATYRFMFFELLGFFIIIYLALQKLQKQTFFHGLFFWLLTAIFIYLPLQHIYTNRNYFFVTQLPQEYFDIQTYLKNNYAPKVYFPPTTPLFHSMATDYSWGNSNYKASILLYKNPYTSLLPLHNLIQFERFPYSLSPHYLELYYLTNLKNKPNDIIQALSLRGVRYIILDKNYNWSANYPSFNLESFLKKVKVDKQIGNILILEIPDKSKDCKKAYGNITIQNCTSLDASKQLVGKTKKEYELEVHAEKIGDKLTINRKSVYTKSILDPILQQALVDNRILFSNEVMQIFGNQKTVFSSKKLEKGKYRVYIPILKYTKESKIFSNANVGVRVADKTIKTFSPYANEIGYYWQQVDITVDTNQEISIDINNDGYIVTMAVPVLQKL